MTSTLTALALVWVAVAVAHGQPTTGDLLAGFMDPLFARRAATVEILRADREDMMDTAAQVAEALASQPAWEAPAVASDPATQPTYVDPEINGAVDLEAFNMGAPGSKYIRVPTISVPPAPLMLTSCPTSNSVKSQGAKGDGTTDDAAAITIACAKLPWLYFPPGNYRIASSITINKTIIVGAGALLTVVPGARLTITQRPRHWDKNAPMFGPTSKVFLSGKADEVHPDWFKNLGESDSDALQQAADSCTAACTIVLSRAYLLTKAVYLNQNVGVISSNAGQLVGRDGTGEGIILRPGRYTRPLSFGTLWGFKAFAIKIQGGVTAADIQLSTIVEAGDGVVFAPDEGSSGQITNVFVTHVTATNAVQNTVVFKASLATQTLNNCLVRGNFMVAPGFLFPAEQSAGLVIRGAAAPTLIATSVIFQAVDAAQFVIQTQFVMLQNLVAKPAVGVVFWVDTWGGGLVGPGQIISGQFSFSRILTRMAGGITDAAQYMTITGPANNKISMGAIASAGAEHIMPTTPDLAQFGGGKVALDQVLYLNAPITGTWAKDEVRIFYLFNVYAKTAANRMNCIPFRAGNAGIVCSRVQNLNSRVPGLIAIHLRNAAAYDIPSWQTSHRFGFQVGP